MLEELLRSCIKYFWLWGILAFICLREKRGDMLDVEALITPANRGVTCKPQAIAAGFKGL